MAQLAHRLAPHDQLVRIASLSGAAGKRMPDFGDLTGLSKQQSQSINEAYDEGRRAFLEHCARSRQ